MAKNEDPERFFFLGGSVPPAVAAAARPTITLPPRPSMDAFFSVGGATGASPGPLTLVSRFFAESTPTADSDQRSFTQLLAGAIASPLARPSFGLDGHGDRGGGGGGGGGGGDRDKQAIESSSSSSMGFKQSRPLNLVVANSPSLFMMSPGLSPSGLLSSPGFFSPPSPFGMSHQQALAQVTAQAAYAQSQMSLHVEYPASSEAVNQTRAPLEPSLVKSEPLQQQQAGPSMVGGAQPDRKYQAPTHASDKPADDGYNWRKYGQKQVKGSEFPRSYYKCTHLNCPVKKKVERSPDGQITEIIYKGQHNHGVPQPGKRGKDGGSDLNGSASNVKSENKVVSLQATNGAALPISVSERDQDSVLVPSDSEDLGDGEVREDNGDADEPNAKRRNIEAGPSEVSLSHKTVTEPKIIVQTRSEVDLLDDGYRWRKYGQKVVKGNPHPRSYYKCTHLGCGVRKHVERASTDPKAVITTYEGKHNHDVPAARNSSHNTANNNAHS